MATAPAVSRPKLAQGEIQARLAKFVTDHASDSDEMRHYATFWDELFRCYGTIRQEVAIYQYSVPKMRGTTGAIDVLWKQKLLVEHKSLGKDLDEAFGQAHDYMAMLPDYERPQYVVICDFQHFRLFDLYADTREDFTLAELPDKWHLLAFLGGYEAKGPANDVDVDLAAVQLLSSLYDQLASIGYPDHQLQRFLVRILFCLFAEDTAIFARDAFGDFVRDRTNPDGTDLGVRLDQFFRVLNMPDDSPLRRGLEASLAGLPYINGGLFADRLEFANTNSAMRQQLLECTHFDWSQISPAIFGSLFQGVMDSQERRALGAHYTSEANIFKVIRPLFLDNLRAQLDAALADKSQRKVARLTEFHERLGTLRFLDPACGCGNFLVISYRELRRLEHEVLLALYGHAMAIDVGILSRVRVSQFCGIEVEEFPSEIARVAMWLMDHVMNRELSAAFGQYFVRLPLTDEAHIVHGNALRVDWNTVLKAEECSFVLGNPPFVGAKFLSETQREDTREVFGALEGGGLLDFVAAWYVLAARYMASKPAIRCAFVSTNSITQGEQVAVLWSWLLAQGVVIHFAHRTFAWTSEARGRAAVHCVVVGFGLQDAGPKTIFEYEGAAGEATAVPAKRINPYLVDGPNLVVGRRSTPLCAVPGIGIGNKPIDGGHYLFTAEEMAAFVQAEPGAKTWFRRWIGADELINGSIRWCLYLRDCPPAVLRTMPAVMARVQAVQRYRAASSSPPTRKLAETPTRFHVEALPCNGYLIFPRHSSETRRFMPLGFGSPELLVGDACLVSGPATPYHFGILTSTMHNAWMRVTAGRLKSDYRYSKDIVYNNFPWPTANAAQQSAIATAAQGVLDARAAHPTASLADLYDPLAMPADLVAAHRDLDRAVDRAYRPQPFKSERERVEFLFGLYEQLTAPLAMVAEKPGRKPRTARKPAGES